MKFENLQGTFEENQTNREKIRWILEHPVWTRQGDNECLSSGYWNMLEFDFVHVNPAKEEIDDDDSLNTAFRVWIEVHVWEWFSVDGQNYEWVKAHYHKLDCGGPTMEAALIELANLVHECYDETGKER